ncbi:MAG: hypothetical protein ABIQ31_25120 [Ferruginibacter sp.]
MAHWNYIVIGLCLLLLAFIFRKEIKRKNRRRLAARLTASLFAVASLACLALPISITKKNTDSPNKKAVLLTEGYNKDSLENFIKTNKEQVRVYQVDSLAWIDTSLTALIIFGHGLSRQELKSLNDIPLIFHSSAIDDGVTSVHWNQKLKSGEKFSVQGIFSNKRSWPVKIALEGFHTPLDSVTIPAKQTKTFEINTFPKQIGKAVYSLLISDKQGALEKEPVPFEVIPVDTLKILLLAASPDFENKFLRNWLAENSYAVASRSRISKDKFDRTFSNFTSFSFDKITNPLLDRFDIIISDATELAALTKTEQAIIQAQVQENGMGLIVKADSIAAPTAFYAAPFTQYSSSAKQPSTAALYIQDADKPTVPLSSDGYSFIRSKPGEQPLVVDSMTNVIVSSKMEGMGKILFTSITNTYTWMLGGNNNDYASFWSCLLQKAARRTGAEQTVLITGAVPKIDEPIELLFEAPGMPLPGTFIAGDLLSLHQNPDLPFQWQGTYWPGKQGWQPALNFSDQSINWYVYGTNDWKNISAIEKTKQTQQYINDKNNVLNKGVVTQKYVPVQLPAIYFLLIFIISCIFLWIEKKLSAL